MFSDALRIKPMLHGLLPSCTHGVIQDFRIDERHFWRSMSHPLLDQDQAHAVVNELNRLGVAKRMEAEMKEISLLITDTMFFSQTIQAISNATSRKRVANQKAWASALLKGL